MKVRIARRDAVIKSVRQLKANKSRPAGIKVELEAQFNRGRNGYTFCESCDEGWVTCSDCDGDHTWRCEECVFTAEGEVQEWCGADNCNAYDGYRYCEYCDEGSRECADCDGDYERRSDDDWDEVTCHDWLMEKLSHLGLAEFREGDWLELSHGVQTEWHPIGALAYAEFYRDGSVDSEFTFTIRFENEESVFLLEDIVRLFRELGETIGNGIDVQGAGMHMALVFDENCVYPGSMSDRQTRGYDNFRRSMTLLMPALFFLGAADDRSRGLRYRIPRTSGDKYSAIAFRNGSLEFRVFDTCYDNPVQVLDNLCVIAKCMRYWRANYLDPGLTKITRECTFGNENDNTVHRFYLTAQHIDLLNQGLAKIKPDHLSISEVKAQRKFTANKRQALYAEQQRAKQAELEYKEYEERFKWQLEIYKQQELAARIKRHSLNSNRPLRELNAEEVLATAQQEVETLTTAYRQSKKSLTRYVQEVLAQFNQTRQGQYVLRVQE